MKDGTRVVRAGLPEPEQGAPFLPGPVLAAPFHVSGEVDTADHRYGRDEHPTWEAYERALGDLEGGDVVLFGSGMAACTAVLLFSLRPGGSLVMPSDCYMHVRELAQTHLGERGVGVTQVPTADLTPDVLPDGVDLLWLETPSNPELDVCDIGALAAAGHERGALVAVDNTLPTPLGQRPLALGADLSVVSATKHMCGHSDLLMGYVAAADPSRADAIRQWRTVTGSIAGPFETWLAHRSLSTLDVRLERAEANALALARRLEGRVDGLRYPGLASDPAHELAARQMNRFGTVLRFDVGSRERAERFLERARLVTDATSFGGVVTMAERRRRWGGDDVPEGFIRLSAGCEATEDLLADVEQALT